MIKVIDGYPRSAPPNFSSNKDQDHHSESGIQIEGSAVVSNEVDGEKVQVLPSVKIEGDQPEEDLPIFLPVFSEMLQGNVGGFQFIQEKH